MNIYSPMPKYCPFAKELCLERRCTFFILTPRGFKPEDVKEDSWNGECAFVRLAKKSI